MTLTIEPTSHEFQILSREADRRGMPLERFFTEVVREAILELEYPEHEPNEETIAAIEEARRGGGKRVSSVEELCRDLGIPCER